MKGVHLEHSRLHLPRRLGLDFKYFKSPREAARIALTTSRGPRPPHSEKQLLLGTPLQVKLPLPMNPKRQEGLRGTDVIQHLQAAHVMGGVQWGGAM